MTGGVSVIIPVYNRAGMVREAIASVQAQTRPAAEIIVVDDGSSQDIRSAVSGLPRVSYLRQQRSGSASARTRGLHAAQGDVIATLDSDDLWHPRFLEESLTALDTHELDLVFSNWLPEGRLDSDLDRIASRRWRARYCRVPRAQWWLLEPAQVRQIALQRCPAPSSAFLLRRSSMPAGWNPDLWIADDWYLLLEIALTRSCRAAFTLDKLWTKRTDGANKYDGREAVDIWRELHVHDGAHFLHDFSPVMTSAERVRQTGRLARRWSELQYLRARRRMRERASAAAPSSTR